MSGMFYLDHFGQSYHAVDGAYMLVRMLNGRPVYRKEPYWLFFSSIRANWEVSVHLDSEEHPIWRSYSPFSRDASDLYLLRDASDSYPSPADVLAWHPSLDASDSYPSPADVLAWQSTKDAGDSFGIEYRIQPGAMVVCAPSPPSPPTPPPIPLPPSPFPPVPPPSPPPPVQEGSAAAGSTFENLMTSVQNDAIGLPVRLTLQTGDHFLTSTMVFDNNTAADQASCNFIHSHAICPEPCMYLNCMCPPLSSLRARSFAGVDCCWARCDHS